MGKIYESRIALVKESKKMKKLRVLGLKTELELEASTLAEDSPFLVPLPTHIRAVCDNFRLGLRGWRLVGLKVDSRLTRALSVQPMKVVSCPRCLVCRG